MNQLIKDCLDYLDGEEASYPNIEKNIPGFISGMPDWDWEVGSDTGKSAVLLENVFVLVLLDMVEGQAEINKLKEVALSQLATLGLSEEVALNFEKTFDQRARSYAPEMFMVFDEEGLEDLLPELEEPKNILQFAAAPRSFIDSYYSMAAHSGSGLDFESPVPPLTLDEGHVLTCAFPDPDNYCRLWFELRQEGKIAVGVLSSIKIADFELNMSSGECELQISQEEVGELLEGRLPLQINYED
jgi:hypothetical protein